MHKFDGNKNCVTFSLAFLRILPSFKNVAPNINATKDMSPRSWAWDELGGKRDMGHFSKYLQPIFIVVTMLLETRRRKCNCVIDKYA
jgi:hypothetical protein